MKIAFSCNKGDKSENVETRFGRCSCFLVVDTDKNTWDKIENTKSMDSPQGAGIQAASNLSKSGVDTVVTGHLGPNAFRTLSAAGIRAFTASGMTIVQALEELQQNRLPEMTGSDVQGHW